jgi:hypothetical protein
MNFDKEGLASLLERVREATGPDRDIDQAIREAIDGKMMERQLLWRETFPYSASIDASLALVERLLPGWTIASMSQQDDKTWFCELREGFLTSYNRVAMSETGYDKGRPTTLPLAILQALLAALNKDVR